jgi:MFS transporter, BCD family, chlorophyll transporter
VMLLVGMVVSSLTFGFLLRDFNHLKLIKIIQGAAVVTMLLNVAALWKQEARSEQTSAEPQEVPPSFRASMKEFLTGGPATRLLVAVGLGGAGFNMQDILLEPYGAEILKLPVSATTSLTALMAGGTLVGLFIAARWLNRGGDPHQLAALGSLIGIAGFSGVIFSSALGSLQLFLAGIVLIGLGGGWFSVGTLTASMALSERGQSGLAIGAWGAVQATVTGVGVVLGGAMRDLISRLATEGALGPGLTSASVGYSFVYHIEFYLLFCTLVALGPLVRRGTKQPPSRFGLADLPT